MERLMMDGVLCRASQVVLKVLFSIERTVETESGPATTQHGPGK